MTALPICCDSEHCEFSHANETLPVWQCAVEHTILISSFHFSGSFYLLQSLSASCLALTFLDTDADPHTPPCLSLSQSSCSVCLSVPPCFRHCLLADVSARRQGRGEAGGRRCLFLSAFSKLLFHINYKVIVGWLYLRPPLLILLWRKLLGVKFPFNNASFPLAATSQLGHNIKFLVQ